MPSSRFPDVRNHLVYLFHANDYPFYVGHGKIGRLSDRPTYVDRLVRLHPDRSYYKWTHHGKVIADLWSAGVDVYFDQITEGQTKAEASSHEDRLFDQLAVAGFLMANEVRNPGVRPVEEIVNAILTKGKRWELLGERSPILRFVRPRAR